MNSDPSREVIQQCSERAIQLTLLQGTISSVFPNLSLKTRLRAYDRLELLSS